MRLHLPARLSVCAAALVASTFITGCEAPEVPPAVAYRDTVMGAIGAHTGAIGAIVSGKVSQTEDIKGHAMALHDLAHMVPGLFAPGTEGGDSSPTIWQQTDAFSEKTADFAKASAELARVASEEGGAVGPAFKALTGTCKGCHDDFKL